MDNLTADLPSGAEAPEGFDPRAIPTSGSEAPEGFDPRTLPSESADFDPRTLTPPKPKPKIRATDDPNGAAKAFGAAAAREVLPGAGALALAGSGAELGASIGTVGGPVGMAAGGIIGGLGGALVGGYLARKAQDAIIPETDTEKALREAHPTASTLGGLTGSAVTMRPSIKNLASAGKAAVDLARVGKAAEEGVHSLVNVGVGAGSSLGIDYAERKARGEDMTGMDALKDVGIGALFSQPTRLGQLAEGAGRAVVSPISSRIRPTPTDPGLAEAPDVAKSGRQFSPGELQRRQAVLDTIRQQDQNWHAANPDVQVSDAPTVSQPGKGEVSPVIRSIERISKPLGWDTIVVRGLSDNGVHVKDITTTGPDGQPVKKTVLLVAEDAHTQGGALSKAAWATFGHEAWHAIKSESGVPGLETTTGAVSDAERVIRESIPADMVKALADRRNAREAAANRGPMSEDKLWEEHGADLMGEAFTRPEFWQAVGQKSPSMYQRLTSYVINFLNKFGIELPDRLKGSVATDANGNVTHQIDPENLAKITQAMANVLHARMSEAAGATGKGFVGRKGRELIKTRKTAEAEQMAAEAEAARSGEGTDEVQQGPAAQQAAQARASFVKAEGKAEPQPFDEQSGAQPEPVDAIHPDNQKAFEAELVKLNQQRAGLGVNAPLNAPNENVPTGNGLPPQPVSNEAAIREARARSGLGVGQPLNAANVNVPQGEGLPKKNPFLRTADAPSTQPVSAARPEPGPVIPGALPGAAPVERQVIPNGKGQENGQALDQNGKEVLTEKPGVVEQQPPPAAPVAAVKPEPAPKKNSLSPKPVENAHDTAYTEVDEAVIQPDITKGQVVSLAKKYAKQGLIKPDELAEIQRVSKDRDMGPEDVADEVKSYLSRNRGLVKRQSTPAPDAPKKPLIPKKEKPNEPVQTTEVPPAAAEEVAPKTGDAVRLVKAKDGAVVTGTLGKSEDPNFVRIEHGGGRASIVSKANIRELRSAERPETPVRDHAEDLPKIKRKQLIPGKPANTAPRTDITPLGDRVRDELLAKKYTNPDGSRFTEEQVSKMSDREALANLYSSMAEAKARLAASEFQGKLSPEDVYAKFPEFSKLFPEKGEKGPDGEELKGFQPFKDGKPQSPIAYINRALENGMKSAKRSWQARSKATEGQPESIDALTENNEPGAPDENRRRALRTADINDTLSLLQKRLEEAGDTSKVQVLDAAKRVADEGGDVSIKAVAEELVKARKGEIGLPRAREIVSDAFQSMADVARNAPPGRVAEAAGELGNIEDGGRTSYSARDKDPVQTHIGLIRDGRVLLKATGTAAERKKTHSEIWPAARTGQTEAFRRMSDGTVVWDVGTPDDTVKARAERALRSSMANASGHTDWLGWHLNKTEPALNFSARENPRELDKTEPIGVRSPQDERAATTARAAEAGTSPGPRGAESDVSPQDQRSGGGENSRRELGPEPSHTDFHDLIGRIKADNPHGSSVYQYAPEDYAGMKRLVSKDGLAAVAVKPDGDIVSVGKHPTSTVKRWGETAIKVAVENGGWKADAFDVALPTMYSKAGMKVVARMDFDPTQAPSDWNYDTYKKYNNGRPDVVFLVHDGIEKEYRGTEGKRVTKYEDGLAEQEKFKPQFSARDPINEKISDKWRRLVTDKFVHGREEAMKRLLPPNAPKTDLTKLSDSEQVLHGSLGTAVKNLENNQYRPLVDAARAIKPIKAQFDVIRNANEATKQFLAETEHTDPLALAELWAYANHAPERNAFIKQRDPNNPAGSGMTDAEAAQILSAFRRTGLEQKMRPISRVIQQVNQITRNAWKEHGLVDPSVVDLFENRWKNYVPLKSPEGSGGFSGKGYDIRGKEAFTALGRATRADNLIGQTFAQAEQALQRGYINTHIGHTLLDLVERYPDGPWTKQSYDMTRVLKDGEVKNVVDPSYRDKDNVFITKKDGKEIAINLDEQRASGLIRALKNLDAPKLPAFMGMVHKSVRMYGNMLTSWNPEFLFPNLVRDFQDALGNASAEGRSEILKKLSNPVNVMKSISGMRQALSGKIRDANGKIAKEFMEQGGAMEPFGGRTSADFAKDLNRDIKRGSLLEGGRKLGAALEDMNKSFENGTRLAVYSAVKEARTKAGMSEAQAKREAAVVAKNITVNFDRKGEMSPWLNTLYLFYNANVQGSARMLKAMTRGKYGRAVGLSLMTMGYVADAVARSQSGDDNKDGRNDWDEKPEFQKESNLIIPLSNGKDVRIPLPYGFSMFYNMGRYASQVSAGVKKPGQAIGDAAALVAKTLNPFGNFPNLGDRSSFSNAITPTLARPFVEASNNKDWKGSPIHPELAFDKSNKPPSAAAARGASDFSKKTASLLNSASGGDDITPGVVSLYPDVIDHFAKWFGGGPGKLLGRSMDFAQKTVKGEETEASNFPVLRRFYANTPKGQGEQDFRDVGKRIEELHARVKAYRVNREPEKAQKLIAESKGIFRLKGRWDGAEKAIKTLYKQRDLAADAAKKKEIQDRIDRLVSANLRVYVDQTGEIR